MTASTMGDENTLTYTLHVNKDESSELTIQRKFRARRIKHLAFLQDEVMAAWAMEMGVTRSAISQVVSGQKKTPRIRRFIEQRLGQQIWE